MPDNWIHEKFDEYLAERGVLLIDGRYGIVHEFIDRGVKYFGSNHREMDSYHNADTHALRDWINGKYNVIGQDLATDWLRAGLGHYCLDEAECRLENPTRDELFDSAYRSMCQKSWVRAKFYPTK